MRSQCPRWDDEYANLRIFIWNGAYKDGAVHKRDRAVYKGTQICMDVYGSVYIHCMEIDLVEANGRLA
jgi:hypothetical protein